MTKISFLTSRLCINDAAIINIELQVRTQQFWDDRSLSYLCRIFHNLEKGEDYSDVRPAYHIGIPDFALFPDYPEFYAANRMMNVKKHYIYNDRFTRNVLDLNQIKLATEEDRRWKLDYRARLFKTSTWEGLKMLARQGEIFEETCETIFCLNRDDEVRHWCEACGEAGRVARTIESNYKKDLAEKNAIIAEKENIIAQQKAESERLLAEKDAQIARLKTLLGETE